MILSKDELTRLKELTENATKGPWTLSLAYYYDEEKELLLGENKPAYNEDFEFIEVSREVIPKLIEAVELLSEALNNYDDIDGCTVAGTALAEVWGDAIAYNRAAIKLFGEFAYLNTIEKGD